MGYSNVNGISLDSARKSPITTNNTLGTIMKKILFLMLLISPLGALADHIDVIEVQLHEGCSVATYVAIKNDFNSQWGVFICESVGSSRRFSDDARIRLSEFTLHRPIDNHLRRWADVG